MKLQHGTFVAKWGQLSLVLQLDNSTIVLISKDWQQCFNGKLIIERIVMNQLSSLSYTHMVKKTISMGSDSFLFLKWKHRTFSYFQKWERRSDCRDGNIDITLCKNISKILFSRFFRHSLCIKQLANLATCQFYPPMNKIWVNMLCNLNSL